VTTRDVQIGRNVQRLRGDLSQQAVADLMRNRGFKWSQATVWSVEKGERPLRVAEGEVLTEALGFGYYKLTGSDTETTIQLNMHAAAKAHAEIERWAAKFTEARANIEAALQHAVDQGEPLPDALQVADGWLDTDALDAARAGMRGRQGVTTEKTAEEPAREDHGD